MHLFYTPDLSGDLYYLNETESKHCVRVLRLNTNDHIHLIDGVGGFYTAKIIDPNPKKCKVEIVESKKEFGKRNYNIHIAIAPTKNMDRFEWFLEKATEIGINEITPILCEHSERKVVKTDRLEKVIISAVKQSIKAYKPKLNEIIPIQEFLGQEHKVEKYIAHCEENEKIQLKNIYTKGQNTIILIGPEGDFSQSEIKLAKENNFQEISLGESRLRTETAGVVACHTINLLNE
ncbi:MAG TPA: 16S rRNA (uracil(1498)-N(3))-methyltransferase [Bacteroidales bacterium]|nr:16S rRNA (uracil(1498)-N(3))-methyltransferase [Bacteroidales bacterium]